MGPTRHGPRGGAEARTAGEDKPQSNLGMRDVSSDSGFLGPVPPLEEQEAPEALVSPVTLAGEERGKGVESPRGEDRPEGPPVDVSSGLQEESGPREPERLRTPARVLTKGEGFVPGPARRRYMVAGPDGPLSLSGTPYSLLQK